MIKQGFIKEIGEPRTFTDKDGNASSPMLVTLAGIVMDERLVQQ